MTTPRKHRHADLIRRWLDDDSLEVEWKNGDTWSLLRPNTITWDDECDYRFKPKMIKCGDLEFPEPMRVAPDIGQTVYLASVPDPELVQWSESRVKTCWLNLGLIHATREAAEQHARALIALTEKKE